MSVSTIRYGIGPSVENKFLKMMLLTGIPFGLFTGIFWSFQYGAISGVVMGIIAGVLFGALMGAFAGYQKKDLRVSAYLTFSGLNRPVRTWWYEGRRYGA